LSRRSEVTTPLSKKVKLLAPPPALGVVGRIGPRQEDWARKDGGSDQCNDKFGHVGVPSGVGH
jgi:hypothetical protein